MNQLISKSAWAYSVSIFICGDIEKAKQACITYCDNIGLCVTVTPTTYCYRGGMQDGMIIGLINYARFPKDNLRDIWMEACLLGSYLKKELGQGSYTVQDNKQSLFISDRDEDQ